MRFSEDRLTEFAAAQGVLRRVHVWQPAAPRAVILAIHGGMAHGGDYVTPALYFRQHGIATVAYDLCGHQDARRVDIPGFATFLDDSLLFLQWVKQQYPGLPIYVMGHSMGALIATHLGLGHFAGETAIKGYILSSPYYVNAIKVSPVLLALAGVLEALAPRMKVPLASLTDQLTHDSAITARHHDDERDGIRATEITVRFGNALTKAQQGLAARMPSWTAPLFAVVAGADQLADADAAEAMLKSVPASLLTYQRYPQNFHENFNELNREQIFADILQWMQ
ncbi:Lysophospholipase, alpha-beta hydrolase superfamily [Duganella sp. CF402]|uniref:alpha/beta fold hydrolase n=1 Tax=unclassified Duganella TaxID=2636909 RepID=UPI0008C60C4D|nr:MULTISPECIES: alpha/beta fold hydrolase [unclassified Duganella]RZT03804.1 alpha-beta hydrolase superfamily lysophospholipase [Duganella sp. BK701]SEM59031.1 Lysophospholipase, alpha-beta hydrolase superfamily [Duganella sp. CF402]